MRYYTKEKEDELMNKVNRVIFSIIRLSNRHKCILRNKLYAEKVGAFPAQHRLLIELSLNPKLTQKELAEKMQVSSATITVCVKKLVNSGLIEKKNQINDNRYNEITITPKGKRIIEKSAQIFEGVTNRMFEGFTEEEISNLENYVKRINDNFDKMSEEGCQADEAVL